MGIIVLNMKFCSSFIFLIPFFLCWCVGGSFVSFSFYSWMRRTMIMGGKWVIRMGHKNRYCMEEAW